MSRLTRWTALSSLLLATFAFAPSSPGDYRIVAHLPDVMDGRRLISPRYDAVSHRLFAGNEVGLYSADLSAAKPKMTGPLAKAFINTLEVAPDLGRVFYAGPTEIGYLNEAGGPAVTMMPHYAWSLAYEPTAHELYAAFELLNEVDVFDAQTGHFRQKIDLPGWSASQLVAIPGRVFMLVKGKDGIYTIDAATHTLAAWPVKGHVTTPGRLEADPTGHYLFFTRMSEVDLIDIPTATQTGKIGLYGEPSTSFDPETGLLVAGWLDNPPERDSLKVLRPTQDGLVPVASLSNAEGGTELTRARYGFVQRGFHEFLIWSNRTSPATR